VNFVGRHPSSVAEGSAAARQSDVIDAARINSAPDRAAQRGQVIRRVTC
jgi:hypothetical protein